MYMRTHALTHSSLVPVLVVVVRCCFFSGAQDQAEMCIRYGFPTIIMICYEFIYFKIPKNGQ